MSAVSNKVEQVRDYGLIQPTLDRRAREGLSLVAVVHREFQGRSIWDLFFTSVTS